MKRKHKHSGSRRTMNDVALLFLRFFMGAIVYLHLIGQVQDYDNVINNYPHLLGFDSATSFAISAILQLIFVTMIMLGVFTRFAASMMLVIAAISFTEALMPDAVPSERSKLDFVYMGIYLTLVIADSGYYSFNVPRWLHNKAKGTK